MASRRFGMDVPCRESASRLAATVCRAATACPQRVARLFAPTAVQDQFEILHEWPFSTERNWSAVRCRPIDRAQQHLPPAGPALPGPAPS